MKLYDLFGFEICSECGIKYFSSHYAHQKMSLPHAIIVGINSLEQQNTTKVKPK